MAAKIMAKSTCIVSPQGRVRCNGLGDDSQQQQQQLACVWPAEKISLARLDDARSGVILFMKSSAGMNL